MPLHLGKARGKTGGWIEPSLHGTDPNSRLGSRSRYSIRKFREAKLKGMINRKLGLPLD
jgi:hypothetical protein